MWSTAPQPQPQGMMWPNSPTFLSGVCTAHPPPGLHAQLSRTPSHMLNTILPINNHHVGSAPSANPSLWDRRHSYAGESPNASGFHPGSLGNMRIAGNSPASFGIRLPKYLSSCWWKLHGPAYTFPKCWTALPSSEVHDVSWTRPDDSYDEFI